MDPSLRAQSESTPYWPWAATWRAILLLAIAALACRLLYLALLSPYTLVEDEAHYWEWSRRLDWSYYSKGPGVALAIAASTRVFGDTEFGVRAPAAIFAFILMIGP
jgi:undecaprenyl-diphosphatase